VQGSGTQGGDQPLAGYSGQDINIWNRQREGDEGSEDDNHNKQGGDGDSNRNSTKDNKADIARKFHLACPFHKRQPEIYNRFHRSPGGKGEYNICESGIPSDKDFK
jgi:hypothetical protein